VSREYPPEPKKIVRPRKRSSTWRPIIAVSSTGILLERGGEALAELLPALIATEPSSIIVAQDFGPHLARIIETHKDHPLFNYRVTPRYRNDRERAAGEACDAIVNFVGFTGDENKKGARYHYPLTPVHLVQCGIDDLRPDLHESRLDKLLSWAQEVRDWCHSHGLQLTPSSGGIVAQLLRDPRFYPKPRRKVPGLINGSARPQLLGNYYRLHCQEREQYRAYYLDISSAHHVIARSIQFPDANSLYYYGRHTVTSDNSVTSDRPRRFYAAATDELLSQYGLFHLSLSVPHIRERSFPPPWGQRSGLVDAWVYSNELDTLRELGVRINGIYTALVSHEVEEGLNRYSRWAIDQLHEHPQYKPWMKPVLHSTYGVLAARPVPFETGYYRAKGGKKREYHIGAHTVEATARTSGKPVESRLANVIHRGMIEAGVRREALWMARYLTEVEGHHILAVYADSLFVQDRGRPLPILPPHWRCETYCSDLVFYDATHFTSSELVRMPGMSRNRRDVARLIARLERQALLQSAHTPYRRAHPSKVARDVIAQRRAKNAAGKAGQAGRDTGREARP
jgi:hypothetical protein